MDKISASTRRAPVSLAREIGKRLRTLRLAKGWTQDELAQRSGAAISTLKLIESKGRGSFQRLTHIAIALGVNSELRELYASPTDADPIEEVKRAERQRAPHRQQKGAGDGTWRPLGGTRRIARRTALSE